MLAHRYKIWPDAWGPDNDPLDPMEKRLVGITARAKRDRESPNEVFNELVCMRLGQLIGLPVPAGIVVEKDVDLFFCSCDIGAAGGELPEADLNRFAQDMQDEACGVMVFDAWIANEDRHNKNLWYDYYSGNFVLIDHGRALFGTRTPGPLRLRDLRNQLGIRADQEGLSQYIRNFDAFRDWYDRIQNIPQESIYKTVEEASSVGIGAPDAQKCAEWLIERRSNLRGLFQCGLPSFPRYRPTLFDPFCDPNVPPEYHI